MRFLIYLFLAVAALLIVLVGRWLLKDFGLINKPKKQKALPTDAPEVLLAALEQRRNARSPSMEHVTDAREAATILLLEMARASGELTQSSLLRIQTMIGEKFSLTDIHAQALITQARWVSSDDTGTEALWKRMTAKVMQHVSPRQVVELDEWLVEISEVESEPTSSQLDVLRVFRNQSGIRT